MKTILIIFIFNFSLLNQLYGQPNKSSFKRIETGNWLELSFRALNAQEEEISFVCMEEMPEFPGGYNALAKFITDTLKYPEKAVNDSIVGRVITTFIIDQNGRVTNVKTLKGIRNDLDSACRKVISIMPNWTKPKSRQYNSISVQFILPIIFIITN